MIFPSLQAKPQRPSSSVIQRAQDPSAAADGSKISLSLISFSDYLKEKKGCDAVGIGEFKSSNFDPLCTDGVAGCLGVVMYNSPSSTVSLGHIFDQAGNIKTSIPEAKKLIEAMIQSLGGDSKKLALVLFNGSGLDNPKDKRDTGLIAWILKMGWSQVIDKSASTTGVITTSSFATCTSFGDVSISK
jgi:hypothetical protein